MDLRSQDNAAIIKCQFAEVGNERIANRFTIAQVACLKIHS